MISLLLELLQNVMKQNDEAFAKVVWIQIANLIKMVQFRRGSKFTVLPTDGKNSDQWRREDPGNREATMEVKSVGTFPVILLKLVTPPLPPQTKLNLEQNG